MNKLFQLTPIPFTSNILILLSAGEKSTLLILIMLLKIRVEVCKNSKRFLYEFEFTYDYGLHLLNMHNQFLGVSCPSLICSNLLTEIAENFCDAHKFRRSRSSTMMGK
jgi:hypothetical protein